MNCAIPRSPALLLFLMVAGVFPFSNTGPGRQIKSQASSAKLAQPLNWTTEQDHQNMMGQLGIKALRPGSSGDPNAPNHANYDEAKANPFSDLPGALTLNDGRRVTSPAGWWRQRRPEIVEGFEREVLGRVPAGVPQVTWTVAGTKATRIGSHPVIEKQLIGRVDNSAYPLISVNIPMTLVTPADAPAPVPVMILFIWEKKSLPESVPSSTQVARPDPPATEQLLADGWGYATLNPVDIQPDNGAGLTRGIIGLTNRGQPRKPADWGALRAWAWGASRTLDYLRRDKAVDGSRIGIEGVSRYGKAALVAMAFDTRFAVVLVGSSGKGGATLYRRDFGEAVENLTGAGEYHWMAGNFLKYGAAEATFGSKNAANLPVDAHELIALCAPRPTFISYGSPQHGDAAWLDQRGSFMAAVAAGPVFRLLGARDLGVADDCRSATMPPINHGLLHGQLAWRQHDEGHTDAPNWKYFIPWADHFLHWTPPFIAVAQNARHAAADQPVPRTDFNSRLAHADLLNKARRGRVDIYFEGDSITRRWDATDYPSFLANWKRNFLGWNAGDFGWGGDQTQNILWRLRNGELNGIHPKIIVLLAGTNNVAMTSLRGEAAADDIARGIRAIVREMRAQAPDATIILMGIFPRNDNMAYLPVIHSINRSLSGLADGKRIRYVNINAQLANRKGKLFPGMMNQSDKLHPTLKAYQVWANALIPIFTQILGPRKSQDLAPAPTGDPSTER